MKTFDIRSSFAVTENVVACRSLEKKVTFPS